VISVAHRRQSLQDKVNREDIDRGEVIFIKFVRIDPGKFLIVRLIVVKTAQEAPEAG
jgi:hypothetical protein